MLDAMADAGEDEQVSESELIDDELAQSLLAEQRSAGRVDRFCVGDTLAGKYRIERVHRAGSLGLTVEAVHLELEQRVMLKVLLVEARAEPELFARFVRGARAAAQIRSEHVARITDVGTLDTGEAYLVSDYLQGTPLHRVLQVRERLAVPEAVDYVLQAAEALAEAHQLGVIHGHLKPSNLLLVREPEGAQSVRVLDFCSAHDSLRSALVDGSRRASAALSYLAPEQIRNPSQIDARVDIWALGAILHELLTGSPLYDSDTTPGVLAMIVADPAPSMNEICADVPAELAAVVLQCLAKHADDRPRTIAELATLLRPFASSLGLRSLEMIGKVASRRARTSKPPPMPRAPHSQPTQAIVHLGPPASERPATAFRVPRRAAELALVCLGFAAAASVGAFAMARSMRGTSAGATRAADPAQRPELVAAYSPSTPAAQAGTEAAPAGRPPVLASASPPAAPKAGPALSEPRASSSLGGLHAASSTAAHPPGRASSATAATGTEQASAPAESKPLEPNESKAAVAANKPATASPHSKDLFDDAN